MHRRKFYTTTSGVAPACGDNELIFVGGIDGNLWLKDGKYLSRNFKQGYRVYDSDGIACSITTNGGGIGGHTGLYAVGAAMRGRYNADGKIEQQIEIRNDELSNAITTVSKDYMICMILGKD